MTGRSPIKLGGLSSSHAGIVSFRFVLDGIEMMDQAMCFFFSFWSLLRVLLHRLYIYYIFFSFVVICLLFGCNAIRLVSHAVVSGKQQKKNIVYKQIKWSTVRLEMGPFSTPGS